MLKKTWQLGLSTLVLALALTGTLSAAEAPVPETAPEAEEQPAALAVPAESEAGAEAEEDLPAPMTPAPSALSDCYSISFHAYSFSECESGCYSRGCGIDYWNSSTCECHCGTKF